MAEVPRRLDPGAALAGTVGQRPLFDPGRPAGDPNAAALPGGIMLHAAPEMRAEGQWSSPAGRLLTLRARVTTGGRWLALHLPLQAAQDLRAAPWLALAARVSAARATAIRPCLRSGVDGGFHDVFWPRAILADARAADHHDLIAPAHLPGLPPLAPWRELVLFLPAGATAPGHDLHLSVHDLRLAAL